MSNAFVICVENDGYEVSLEKRKLYEKLPDKKSESHGLVRVIDESGEDYLYPSRYFIPIKLPARIEQAVLGSA